MRICGVQNCINQNFIICFCKAILLVANKKNIGEYEQIIFLPTNSVIFQFSFDEKQQEHIYTIFFDRLRTAHKIYCCQSFCNKKKWHSKSRSRFCLIKMTLFKEHERIYLHNQNHSSSSCYCNAIKQAYINSRQAIYLRFVNKLLNYKELRPLIV